MNTCSAITLLSRHWEEVHLSAYITSSNRKCPLEQVFYINIWGKIFHVHAKQKDFSANQRNQPWHCAQIVSQLMSFVSHWYFHSCLMWIRIFQLMHRLALLMTSAPPPGGCWTELPIKDEADMKRSPVNLIPRVFDGRGGRKHDKCSVTMQSPPH